MIVADTCLIFHLFNETLLTDKAQEVLEKDPNWVLPPLWREEYANILSKLARKEGRNANKVITHFNNTLEELKNCEIRVETEEALKISLDYSISVYDAHFIALAVNFNTLLITEDKEILKKCPSKALSINSLLSKK